MPKLVLSRRTANGDRVIQRRQQHVVFREGAEIAAFRCESERGDLSVMDFEGFNNNARVAHGWGTDLTNTGGGGFTPLPNFALFVGSIIEAVAPAF
jgi:hypothetical protein